MSSLWPPLNEMTVSENNSAKILRDQAKALDAITSGRVRATFSKTDYKKVPINPDIDPDAFDMYVPFGYETIEVFEDNLATKKDANALFVSEEYKFEIYNDTYRFRVFKVNCNIVYPISIILDSDIAKELKLDINQQIADDAALKELLKSVFSSKKLLTIINRIMQNSK